MNINTTHRIAAAVVGASIALGVTACGSASGKTSEAPEAPAVAQNVGSEPKSDNEPSQQCYPLEGRHAEIELYYAHADGLDAPAQDRVLREVTVATQYLTARDG